MSGKRAKVLRKGIKDSEPSVLMCRTHSNGNRTIYWQGQRRDYREAKKRWK